MVLPSSRFQSTLPCGSDYDKWVNLCGEQEFQSTLPCGSDLLTCFAPANIIEFQSTLPCGSDYLIVTGQGDTKSISIHAPLRERQRRPADSLLRRYFNPRSLAGATYNYQHRYQWAMISIHAPLRERLQISQVSLTGAAISIHAPLRERHTTTNIVTNGQ